MSVTLDIFKKRNLLLQCLTVSNAFSALRKHHVNEYLKYIFVTKTFCIFKIGNVDLNYIVKEYLIFEPIFLKIYRAVRGLR